MDDSIRYQQHEECKLATKMERDKDRLNSDSSQAVVCFDLQNVITLPNANIKSSFSTKTGSLQHDSSLFC